jgi:hypothetical protein
MASDPAVRVFRDKYERDLRKLVTLGCAVAGCANDGNGAMEEAEMDALAKVVIGLVEKAKRPRKTRELPDCPNVSRLRVVGRDSV